jgi:hypothetical protein
MPQYNAKKAGAGMERREPSDIDEARKLSGESESIEPACEGRVPLSRKPERDLEAGAGIEPANSGFADRDLTTWLPRRVACRNELSNARTSCQFSGL